VVDYGYARSDDFLNDEIIAKFVDSRKAEPRPDRISINSIQAGGLAMTIKVDGLALM